MSEELRRMPAAVLCERIARRDVSPVEVTHAMLDRCERLQPTLNCFITPRADNGRLSDEWERATRFLSRISGDFSRACIRHTTNRAKPVKKIASEGKTSIASIGGMIRKCWPVNAGGQRPSAHGVKRDAEFG